MKHLLLLFCKYANGNLDILKKAVGGRIQHKNGKWAKIIGINETYIYLEGSVGSVVTGKFYWSNLRSYFIDICLNESLVLEIYKRFENTDLVNLLNELSSLLDQYQFEDAKTFYQEKCAKIITPQDYQREYDLYLSRFRNSQKSSLINQLISFLKKYQFEDAENFYHSQCAEIITLEEYKGERNFYLNQFRNLKKPRLMNQLKHFWEKYQFEDAESFGSSGFEG